METYQKVMPFVFGMILGCSVFTTCEVMDLDDQHHEEIMEILDLHKTVLLLEKRMIKQDSITIEALIVIKNKIK